jgi:hypothetical protein
MPTQQDFYDVFGTKLFVVIQDIPMTLRDVSAQITITSAYTGQKIAIAIDQTSEAFRTYPIRNPATISFDSSAILYNTFAFVQFYDGSVIPILAQSTLHISYSSTGYIVDATGTQLPQTLADASVFIDKQTQNLHSVYDAKRTDFFVDALG